MVCWLGWEWFVEWDGNGLMSGVGVPLWVGWEWPAEEVNTVLAMRGMRVLMIFFIYFSFFLPLSSFFPPLFLFLPRRRRYISLWSASVLLRLLFRYEITVWKPQTEADGAAWSINWYLDASGEGRLWRSQFYKWLYILGSVFFKVLTNRLIKTLEENQQHYITGRSQKWSTQPYTIYTQYTR